MAKEVLTDAFVEFDGNDLSDHVRSVTVNYEAEGVDDTCMGLDTRTQQGGLKSWSIEVEAANDWAASQIDSIMFPLVGTTATIKVRKSATDSVGATNPSYQGTGLLRTYNPIGGVSVGGLATAPFTIESAGTLSRATS
ncbi:MAG: radical SAM protein [Spongiibacteraceae bacterium]|uniref:hypothetical protein n=1 Tax=uncultured Haliea sp. TaxID=622616 RepID=UPI000C523C9A|nr:radical SAM protein [Spongiibacteraceae bacterium]|tara:strand:+ start:447 stop:860 length:414 start_codon:yes stop_codon:yes gene_type:complete